MSNSPVKELLPQEPYRELTVAAVVLGVIQGVVLNLAFVYAALKLGFSIGGSTVASIMGYALLRGVLRKGSMVENNINQTIASGINTAGTGIVFTVPALFMLDAAWRKQGLAGLQFQLLPLLIAGIAGGVLGVVAIIPLRKQMIELDRLRFPSGVATATIIRAGASGTEKAILLGLGILISAAVKLVMVSGVLETPELVKSHCRGQAGHGLGSSGNA
jgi:putative OPT family oligopeptide transporter